MTRTVLTLLLIMAAPLLTADVLLIEQVRQVDSMTVPVNGQTMAEVESAFGAPSAREARWANRQLPAGLRALERLL